MINVCFVTLEAIETIKKNIDKFTQCILDNPGNNVWLKSFLPKEMYVTKKFKIKNFDLKLSPTGNYKEVEYENSLILHENLKHLPRYVLTDERFWLWLLLDKFYQVAIQAMPIKSKTTIMDHWLFAQGKRRGVFFGVLSRSYFRVELSYDESLEDKYELTKYVIENPERFRNLSWRAFSNQKKLVLGILKAEKQIEELYPNKVSNSIFPKIAKYVGRYGSVRLLDGVTEKEIHTVVFDKMKSMVED